MLHHLQIITNNYTLIQHTSKTPYVFSSIACALLEIVLATEKLNHVYKIDVK
jgi:hypothetical protein